VAGCDLVKYHVGPRRCDHDMPITSDRDTLLQPPHRRFGQLLALTGVVLTVLGGTGVVAYLCAAPEPVDLGLFTIYGPSWDGFTGASIPVTYDRWRIGPFFLVRAAP
jgi:hypothetical protein